MSATFMIDPKNGIIFARHTGSVTSESIINLINRFLKDPLFTKGMPVIIDVTEANLEFGFEGNQQIRNHVSKLISSRGEYKCAVVTSDELTYGTIRQYSALMSSIGIEVGIFQDPEQALEWIKK